MPSNPKNSNGKVFAFIFTALAVLICANRSAHAAIIGDINGDGNVDILDFQILSNAFGKTQGQSGYNPLANLNNDGSVDILDFQILSNNFGRRATPTITPTRPPSTTPVPTQAGGSAVIVAAGDIACGSDSGGAACKEWETSELVRQVNPAAVLILGDNQYEWGQYQFFTGTDPYCSSFSTPRCYGRTWGRFKNITRPAIGNHEYGQNNNPSGYYDYFNGIGVNNGPAGERSKGYYAYDLGGWRMIALNTQLCGGEQGSGCSRNSAQAQWLQAELQQSIQRGIRCQLVYIHHPLWTSGSRISESTRPFHQIMYENKAEVVLAGHEHNYERFAPMDGNSNRVADGVRGIVVGTGGRNFTAFTHLAVNSEVRNATTFGVLKMTLHPDRYDLNFIPIPGSSFTDTLTNQRCN